ncbi:hypothetical protein BBO99_00001051 [Phytophthora kernoviae]|uniref:Transmembrane 9 superfamily member n=2 Tax=Phytophthora kernoviae TaxID=325452 RepID=A0A3R7K2R0_9STRA|nr:hypothetical protein G195_009009 [Phytophthora kernoviae 00238/432]KAG2532415.1 hypothetical protein JM16_000406 [Phytophthora kernoviae]KAG2533487.1 hypothetical protein JM18_000323 [Phytophthora kernoviae]RLN06706.1 hypothetical protein BBI17_001022 [Phytophthora kernoviae]RLN84738.1 hypothetical protein BBO99_00001051 [Phytophthora kernoviae]
MGNILKLEMAVSGATIAMWLLFVAAFCVAVVDADDYKMRDEVLVIANTIRPYANPTETYQYYKLPYCKPKERQWDDHDLGELLTGSRKVVTDYRLYFGVDQTYAQLCKLQINPDVMKAFKDAVDEDYEISFSPY